MEYKVNNDKIMEGILIAFHVYTKILESSEELVDKNKVLDTVISNIAKVTNDPFIYKVAFNTCKAIASAIVDDYDEKRKYNIARSN